MENRTSPTRVLLADGNFTLSFAHAPRTLAALTRWVLNHKRRQPRTFPGLEYSQSFRTPISDKVRLLIQGNIVWFSESIRVQSVVSTLTQLIVSLPDLTEVVSRICTKNIAHLNSQNILISSDHFVQPRTEAQKQHISLSVGLVEPKLRLAGAVVYVSSRQTTLNATIGAECGSSWYQQQRCSPVLVLRKVVPFSTTGTV